MPEKSELKSEDLPKKINSVKNHIGQEVAMQKSLIWPMGPKIIYKCLFRFSLGGEFVAIPVMVCSFIFFSLSLCMSRFLCLSFFTKKKKHEKHLQILSV